MFKSALTPTMFVKNKTTWNHFQKSALASTFLNIIGADAPIYRKQRKSGLQI